MTRALLNVALFLVAAALAVSAAPLEFV